MGGQATLLAPHSKKSDGNCPLAPMVYGCACLNLYVGPIIYAFV